MNHPADQERVLEVLGEALEQPDAAGRSAYLDGACAGDAALRARVEQLLASHDRARTAFDAAADEMNGVAASHVGPYKLIDVIGEGGMGVVYRAEQLRPVRRIVALKLIKLGMDTREVIARFESERQALAMMNHPNVARVFDAGATGSGRPYFVMEYVAGEPITTFCDAHRCTIRQRLELFMQACDATQHAHQKAIIHRDLKPSNILVANEDGRPRVKVIDFGIAKAVENKLTERTLFTGHGQLVGTPEYVSPEQADLTGGIDVDTRADVYSLGIVLYELLTGALPFDPKTLRNAGYHEIQRIVRETAPPRPSTRLAGIEPERAVAIARQRQTEPAALRAALRGELEWIPLKAMAKDRAERYASAADLAHDVQNYLERRPLVAGPPSAAYRARKFLSRHRLPVAAAAAVLVALAAGVVATGVALLGQSRARAEAEVGQARAEAVIQFLTEDILSNATPEKLPDKHVRDAIVRAMIDPAAESIDERFGHTPLVEAQVRDLLAQFYLKLGRVDLGLKQAERALERRRALLGDEHPQTLVSLNTLASALKEQGRLDEAEAMHREAYAARRRTLGPEHAETLKSLNNLAGVLYVQGRIDEAVRLQRQVVEGDRRALRPNDVRRLPPLNNLALYLKEQGKLDEAEAIYVEVLEQYRRIFGTDHLRTLTLTNNLASLLRTRRKYAESEPLLRHVLEVRRRTLGDDHSATHSAMHNLVVVLQELGRLDEAEDLARRTLEARERTIGPDDARTLSAMNNLLAVLMRRGDVGRAAPLVETLRQRIPRSQLPVGDAGNYLSNAGRALLKLGRADLAEAPLRDAERLLSGSAAHAEARSVVVAALAEVCEKTGRPDEASRLRRALDELPPATAPAPAVPRGSAMPE